ILDMATGDRTIVYRSPASLQAPNWTRDGTALIYNSQGLLYRFDLADRRPVALNTGFATSNNNDHVLSFDGRTLGISNHSADDHDASIVYTVPVGGGTPRRVTALGPSYLHGWSPDGRFLVYTGERSGEFDVYRIPVDGGEETRLTNTPGLDDGPEDLSVREGGGRARVVAYVYGGQGTVNVPSWSPDSRRLAFVSNTDLRRLP